MVGHNGLSMLVGGLVWMLSLAIQGSHVTLLKLLFAQSFNIGFSFKKPCEANNPK